MRKPNWFAEARRRIGLPLVGLLLVAAVAGCATAQASTGGNGAVCYIPAANGEKPNVTVKGVAPSSEQLNNAYLIIAAGKEHSDPQISQNPWAWTIAIATAIQESTLIVVDHGDTAGPDSRGLFQQRDSWGPYEVRMDPKGSATLFYNALAKVDGWQNMPLTAAAQEVQNSGFPDAYAQWEEEAKLIVAAGENIVCQNGGGAGNGDWVNPVPGSYVSSGFGPRDGEMHSGVDLAAPDGTPIYAVGAGTVLYAGTANGFGHAIYIQHDNGDVTVYGHMWATDMVQNGQQVKAGQQIAKVGSDGNSTGPHLHLEVHVGGQNGEKIDPVPWLKERGVTV